MKKEDIEEGIKIFAETLKKVPVRIDFKKDTCYLRKNDGVILDSSNKERYVLGYVLITEDQEKAALLDKMVEKGVQKRNIKFEDLGELA